MLISQRAAGGGIAVWKELLNGLSRADLKSRLVSKKAQKVGTDGNRNRYLAAYMLVYG